MRCARFLLIVLGVLLSGVVGMRPVAAHDFWVQPGEYQLMPGHATSLTLLVGHGPDRQRSSIPLRRITRFEALGPRGFRADFRSSLQLGGRPDDGTVAFRQPGTYALVLQTDERAYSLLPAIRFNDYLRVEGLTPALLFRERTHRTSAEGSETYSRQAKTIIQVGEEPDLAPVVTQPLGLSLEIVPDVDPYAERCPKRLPVHVLYRGRPLSGALVKLTDLEHDANPIEMHLTDGQGRAVFGARERGAWLLNVIWTEVAPMSSDADFKTTFSSLTFGHRSSPMKSAIAGPQDVEAVSRAVAQSTALQPRCGKWPVMGTEPRRIHQTSRGSPALVSNQ